MRLRFLILASKRVTLQCNKFFLQQDQNCKFLRMRDLWSADLVLKICNLPKRLFPAQFAPFVTVRR